MECKVVRKNGELRVHITGPSQNLQYSSIESNKIHIYGSLILQVKWDTSRKDNGCLLNTTVSVCVYDTDSSDSKNGIKYKIKLTCLDFDLEDFFLYTDENHWHIIRQTSSHFNNSNFMISVQIEPLMQMNFLGLCDDELTDFNLRSNNGLVTVHKACLAAVSPFFKSKLINDSKDNILDVPETSLQALQDFKTYIYQNVLPENNLEELLLVASYFEIKALELRCVYKILLEMKGCDIINTLEFSLKHRHMPLFLGIMEFIQRGLVNMCEIREYCLKQ